MFEVQRADLAQADALGGRRHFQKLCDQPGLDRTEMPGILLAIQRRHGGHLAHQEYREGRFVKNGAIGKGVDPPVEAIACRQLYQPVLAGVIVIRTACQALDPPRFDVQVRLHGV